MNRIFALLLVLSAASSRLGAVMIDEIQVYTDDINAVGKFGVELHLNTTLQGRRVPDFPGEIVPEHGVRITPEFSYGLSRDFEAGLYVPMHLSSGGGFDPAGAKLRMKWLPVQPDATSGGWFAGANTELGWLPDKFDENNWGLELRTMFGFRQPQWLVAVNPVFGWDLSGPGKSSRPEFEFQVKAAREIARGIAFGPEYYAGFGPLGRALPFDQQDHALYAAFDVDLAPWIFNVGIGRGVSHAADRWTLKFIFETPW